jgi:hypothetical protein
LVRTNIVTSARNRPLALTNPVEASPAHAEAQGFIEAIRKEVEDKGMPPAQIADHVVAAIRVDKFYILTHPKTKELVRVHMEGILEERNPTAPPS